MKRITAAVITVIYFIMGIGVSAADVDSKAYFDITSLQIMTGDENGDLHLDDKLTRAEFASVMTRLLRYGGLAASLDGAVDFSDVNPDDWFAGHVGVAYATGIMNGVGTGRFAPMEPVTYEQAVKTLVTVLGYGIQAVEKGGYPSGYLLVGGAIGLTRNVSIGETFTRGDLMQLLYNALDINMMVAVYGGTEMYKIEQGKTFRNLYLNTTGDVAVGMERGIVTANADTWLTSPSLSLKSGEVEIDDIKYRVGDTNAADYIGQMVDFYTFEEEGIKTLLSVRGAKVNTVTDIDLKNITNASISRIDYEKESGREFVDISGAKIIRNGRMVFNPDDSALSCSKGSIRTVDNNGDGAADVVFVDDFINIRVKEVKGDTIEFAPGDLLDNSRFLRIDSEGNDIRYNIIDGEGKKITLEDITDDCILSISADADRELYKIVVSDNRVEGTVQELSEDIVMIDGDTYPIYSGETFGFAPGGFGTAYLDYKGYVAGFKVSETTGKYAYLLAADTGGVLSGNITVKMLVGSQVEFEYDKNEQNLDDTNLIPVLNCKNAGARVFEIANTLSKDGTVYKSSESKMTALTRGLYTYEANSEGKITKMTSAQLSGGGTNMKYNAYDKTFAGNDFRTSFAIDQDTVVINLPTNTVASDEDYLVPLKISNKASNTTFFTEGYDLNDETKKVKMMVFHNIMRADDVLGIEGINIGMVESVSHVLDVNGETEKKFTIVTKAGKSEYIAKFVSGKNDELTAVKEGDLIYFEIDLSGKLCQVDIIQSFAQGISNWNDFNEMYGYVADIEYDEIHTSTGNLVTRVKANTFRGEYMVEIQQRNMPPIFIYNRAHRSISTASISAILPGNNSEMFYALKDLDDRAIVCVIYR